MSAACGSVLVHLGPSETHEAVAFASSSFRRMPGSRPPLVTNATGTEKGRSLGSGFRRNDARSGALDAVLLPRGTKLVTGQWV